MKLIQEREDGREVRPACQADPFLWDLDRQGESLLEDWGRAQRECAACPFQAGCRKLLDEAYPNWWDMGGTEGAPHLVIWAGWAFGSTGRMLTAGGLRQLAATRRQEARREQAAREHARALQAQRQPGPRQAARTGAGRESGALAVAS